MTTAHPLLRAKPKARSRRLAAFGALLARRPQRPVALAFAAAAVGLIAAEVGPLRPAGRALDQVPPGDVALVNGEPILMSDFLKDTETLENKPFAETTPAERAHSLHVMIDQELLVQRALALGLPELSTEVRTALSDAVNAQVDAPVLASPPGDAELAAYYAAHRSRYETWGDMAVTDLVLHVGGFENADQTVAQAMADAEQAVYELRSGAPLAFVKQHFGFVDSGRVNGSEMDFAARIHLGPKLYAAAEGLSEGQVSEPVADADGVHILIMQSRHAPVFSGLDQVRSNVYTDYINAAEARAQQENLRFLRSNARILLAPGLRE